jgi:hypothetical protein
MKIVSPVMFWWFAWRRIVSGESSVHSWRCVLRPCFFLVWLKSARIHVPCTYSTSKINWNISRVHLCAWQNVIHILYWSRKHHGGIPNILNGITVRFFRCIREAKRKFKDTIRTQIVTQCSVTSILKHITCIGTTQTLSANIWFPLPNF